MWTRDVACIAVTILVAVTGCHAALSDHQDTRSETPTSLPEGDGLAARYVPNRLLADTAVVFADDAESYAAGMLPNRFAVEHPNTWNSPWDVAWGGPSITRDTEHVHSGRQAFEYTLNGPGAIGVRKYLSAGFDRLFFRYYIKYDRAFPGAHHVGGWLAARASGLPDANPGVRPDGANQFDISLDHWTLDRRIVPPGDLIAYVYHMEQQHEWGEVFYPSGKTLPGVNAARGIFGPSFIPRRDFRPVLGRWYCYELMVQANTPAQRDGRVAFWVDGRLIGDFPNLRFRNVDRLKINQANLSMYESRARGFERVWFDDVVVATAYIGPMASDNKTK